MALRAKQYFEDYDLEETVDEKGRVRRRYVYHGDLFERQRTESQHRLERYFGVVISAVAACLTVLAITRDTPVNRGGFFAMISVLSLIPAFCAVVGSWIALFQKKTVTRDQYRDRYLLQRIMPLVQTALLLVIALGYGLGKAWTALFFALGAAILYGAMGFYERSVKYTVHPGTKQHPERKGWRQRMKEGNHD